MPFQSEKQRKYLHANHPEIANRWEAKYGLGGIAELNSQLNQLPEYYLPKNQGGLIPSHEAGIYGLAEGGSITKTPEGQTRGFVQARSDGRRPGYTEDDEDTGGAGHHGGGHGSQSTSTSSGEGGGYQNVHQTGAVTQTPARTSTPKDEGPKDGPDPHGGDWEEGWLNKDLKKVNEILNDPNANRREKEQALVWKDQFNKKIAASERARSGSQSNPVWTALKWIGTGAAIIGTGGTALGLGGNKIVQTAQLINKVNKLTNGAVDGYNFINKTDFTREELFNKIQNDAKVVKETHQKKMDLYKSLPDGHPEKIALSVELEIGKKTTPDGPHDPDGVTQDTSITIDNIEEVNKKKMELASINQLQVQKEVDRSKRDAYLAAFRQKYLMGPTTMAAGGGRIPQGYNTGGLSNLFRLKNR